MTRVRLFDYMTLLCIPFFPPILRHPFVLYENWCGVLCIYFWYFVFERQSY